jgi:hypothetical protein
VTAGGLVYLGEVLLVNAVMRGGLDHLCHTRVPVVDRDAPLGR